MAYSKGPNILGTQAHGQGSTAWDAFVDPVSGGYEVVDISKQLGDSTDGYSVSQIVSDMIRLKNTYLKKIHNRGLGKIERALWTDIVTKKVNRAQEKNQNRINANIKPELLNDYIIRTKTTRNGTKIKHTGPDYQREFFAQEGIFDPVLLYIDSNFPSNDIAGDVPEEIMLSIAHPMGLTQAFIAKSTVMSVIKRHHRGDHILLYANSKTANMASKDYITGGNVSSTEKWGGTSLATGNEMLRLADSGKIGNFMEFKVIETGALNKSGLNIIEILSDSHIGKPGSMQLKLSQFMLTYYPGFKGMGGGKSALDKFLGMPALNLKSPNNIETSKVMLPGMESYHAGGKQLQSSGLRKGNEHSGVPQEWHVEYKSAYSKRLLTEAGWTIITEFSDAAGIKRGEAAGWAKPPESLNLDRPLLAKLKLHNIDGVRLTNRSQAAKMGMGDHPIKQTVIFEHGLDKIRSKMLPSPHYGIYGVSNTLKIRAAVMADAGIDVKDGLLVRKNVNKGVVDKLVNQIIASDVQKIIDDKTYLVDGRSDLTVSEDISKFRNRYQFENEWVILKLDAPKSDIDRVGMKFVFETGQFVETDDKPNLNDKRTVQRYVVTPRNIWPESVINSGQIWGIGNTGLDGIAKQYGGRPTVEYTRTKGIDHTGKLTDYGYQSYGVHPHIEFDINTKNSEFSIGYIDSHTDQIKVDRAFYEAIGFSHFSFDERGYLIGKAEGKLKYARVANEMKYAMFGSDIVRSNFVGGGTVIQTGHTPDGGPAAQRFWQEVYGTHSEMAFDYLWNANTRWQDVEYQTETVYGENGHSHEIVTGSSPGTEEFMPGDQMRERFVLKTGSLSSQGILVPYGDVDALVYDSPDKDTRTQLEKRKRYEIRKLEPHEVLRFTRPLLSVNLYNSLTHLTDIQKRAVLKASANFKLPSLTSHVIGRGNEYNVSDMSPKFGAEKPIGKNGGIVWMSPKDYAKMAHPLEFDLTPWSQKELDAKIATKQEAFDVIDAEVKRLGIHKDESHPLNDEWMEAKEPLDSYKLEQSKIKSSYELYMKGTTYDAVPQFNIRYDPDGGIEYGKNQSSLGPLKTKPGQAVVAPAFGDFWAHDGRHRALALEYAGVKLMPVLLIDSKGNPANWQNLGKDKWPTWLLSEKFIKGFGKNFGTELVFPMQWEDSLRGRVALPYNVNNKELKKWVDEHQGPLLRSKDLTPRQRELVHLATKMVEDHGKPGKAVRVSTLINGHADWVTKFAPETRAYVHERIVLEINESYGVHELYIAKHEFVPPMSSADIMTPYTLEEYSNLTYTSDKTMDEMTKGTGYSNHDLAEAVHITRGNLAYAGTGEGAVFLQTPEDIQTFVRTAKEFKVQLDIFTTATFPFKIPWNDKNLKSYISEHSLNADIIYGATNQMDTLAFKLDKMLSREGFMVLLEPSKIILKKPLVVERYSYSANPSNVLHQYSATVVDPNAPIGMDPRGKPKTRYILPEGTHVYLPLGGADLDEVLIDGATLKEKWTSSSAKKHNIPKSHTYDYVKILEDGKLQFHDIDGNIIKIKANEYGGLPQDKFSINEVTIEAIHGQGILQTWETFKKRIIRLKSQIIKVEKKGGYVHPVMKDFIDKFHQDMKAVDAATAKAKAIRASMSALQVGLSVLGIGGVKRSTRVFTGGIFIGASVFFQEHYYNRMDAMAYDEKHPDQDPTWTPRMEAEYQRYDWMWGHLWLTKIAHRFVDDDQSSRGALNVADAIFGTTGAAVSKSYNELTLEGKMDLWISERWKVYNRRYSIGENFAKVMTFIEPFSDMAAHIDGNDLTLDHESMMKRYKPELWKKHKTYILTKGAINTLTAQCEALPADSPERRRCELEVHLYKDTKSIQTILENPPTNVELYNLEINPDTGKVFANSQEKLNYFTKRNIDPKTGKLKGGLMWDNEGN